MKMSTKGRYASQAMLDLALNFGDGPVLLKDIARRQGISQKYLERILSMLKTTGLVKSNRGFKGGYYLSRDPQTITLKDIIFAVEGPVSPAECLEDIKFCSRRQSCATYEIWMRLKKAIIDILESTTLSDLIKIYQQKNKNESLEM
jgi:Rrf2 family protein